VIFSPHIGGITRSTFLRAHKNIWKNVEAISKGDKPINIVSEE
jgi:phosphoglycerate dehydrogenase-like enzyme